MKSCFWFIASVKVYSNFKSNVVGGITYTKLVNKWKVIQVNCEKLVELWDVNQTF